MVRSCDNPIQGFNRLIRVEREVTSICIVCFRSDITSPVLSFDSGIDMSERRFEAVELHGQNSRLLPWIILAASFTSELESEVAKTWDNDVVVLRMASSGRELYSLRLTLLLFHRKIRRISIIVGMNPSR